MQVSLCHRGHDATFSRTAQIILSVNCACLFCKPPTGGANTDLPCCVGVTKSGARRRAMLAFDIGREVPVGSTINSATLHLYMDRMSPQWTQASTYSFHRLTTAFGEGTSFVNNGQGAPASAGDSTWAESILGETSWTTAGGDFVSTATTTEVLQGTSTTPGLDTKRVRVGVGEEYLTKDTR
jgi:hypothetical protein